MSNIISFSEMIASELKKLRTDAGYTLKSFACLINKSEQQLYRYEYYKNKIDIDTLVVALKILNVDIVNFFNDIAKRYYIKI
ncbi:helix-turn-helix transcriptional regulator [Providencia rettgeri]|nr:helix-turn-helix transcriptional regulator [Providencia rettgeri]